MQILLDHQILSDCLGSAEHNEGGSKGWEGGDFSMLTRRHVFIYGVMMAHVNICWHYFLFLWKQFEGHDMLMMFCFIVELPIWDSLNISLHHADPVFKTRYLKRLDQKLHQSVFLDLYLPKICLDAKKVWWKKCPGNWWFAIFFWNSLFGFADWSFWSPGCTGMKVLDSDYKIPHNPKYSSILDLTMCHLVSLSIFIQE